MIDANFYLTGRIGKITVRSQAVTSVSVAVDERRKTDQGWDKTAHWFNLSFFGKQAEAIQKAQVGSSISVSGEMKTWKDKDNKPQTSFNVRDAVIGVNLFALNKQSNAPSVQSDESFDFGPEPKFDDEDSIPF
jgi:single-stranded DNA-binding protein